MIAKISFSLNELSLGVVREPEGFAIDKKKRERKLGPFNILRFV